jgi:hypothetical protein
MQTNQTVYTKARKQNKMKRKRKKNKGRAIAVSDIWSKQETEEVPQNYYSYQVSHFF